MRIPGVLAIGLMLGVVTGCASLGPREIRVQSMPWKNFEVAIRNYDAAEEGKTNLAQLRILGFDIEKVSGAEEWDEITTREHLMGANPNIRMDMLPAGARRCLQAEGGCRTHVFRIDITQKVTEGRYYLLTEVILGIEERRRIVGSRLEAKFFISTKDLLVLFKTRTLEPFKNELTIKKDPLAPITRLGRALQKLVCPWC